MTGTAFSTAIAAGIASLNTDGLTRDQWADAATQCARSFTDSGIDDPVVRSAASLGGVIRPHSATASTLSSTLVEAFAATTSGSMDSGSRESFQREGRTALAFATHAAMQNSHGLAWVFLAGVERDLMAALPEPTTAPLWTTLENWRTSIALVGRDVDHVSPHLAVAIVSHQLELLRRSRELLSKVDVNRHTPGSPDRLLDSIDRNIAAWSGAADRCYDKSLGTVPHDAAEPATRRLSFASMDLSTALVQELPASTQLEALIRTGFGGNLIAGIVVSGTPSINDKMVVPVAHRLEAITDHFTDPRFGPPFHDRIPSPAPPHPPAPFPTAADEVHPVPQPPVAGVSEPPVRADLDVAVQHLTRDQENELARRRDVGVLAQAALDGDPTASGVTAVATKHELRCLAADGRAAVAQLIASMIPTMVSTNRWIPRDERSDAVQNAAVDVAAAAMRWDPTKGARWLTFAWNTSQWASTDSRKAIDARPLPYEFDLDTLGRPLHNGEPDPEQQLLSNLERSEKRHLLHKIRSLDPGEIRPDLLAVVVRYHGLDGDPPRNFTQIAKDRDSSPTTVTRHYYEAIEVLRGIFPTAPAPPPTTTPKPWKRPEHLQRHTINAPRR